MKFFEICAEVRLPEVATEVKAVPLVETEPVQEFVSRARSRYES